MALGPGGRGTSVPTPVHSIQHLDCSMGEGLGAAASGQGYGGLHRHSLETSSVLSTWNPRAEESQEEQFISVRPNYKSQHA